MAKRKCKNAPYWTEEESSRLREVFHFIFPEEATILFPGRTWKSIRARGTNMGLHRGCRKVLFPREYTNDTDGGYVSGLVDGEGCFMVSLKHRDRTNYNPKFGINLRRDDIGIILWLQSYFGCGRLQFITRKNGSKPAVAFTIANLYDIMRSVVPHFTKYPLRAKKRNDYETWLELVEIQAQNFRSHSSWTPEIIDKMGDIYKSLRQNRAYKEPVT